MDRNIPNIIAAIKRHRQDFALSACTHPQDKGDIAFAYGRACGFVQGLEMALALIETELKKDEEDHGPRRRDR
jgi:hypothetical protein